ncbi:MAG: hypothetical protein DRI86_09840 [Bacteroidetes bacterium]|nr:MAG: hypothetical protein DRI86_09840 [Bacteroidota bacterium]
MNYNLKKIFTLLSILLIFISSCSKETIAIEPNLTISTTTEALTVSLKGDITDDNNIITEIVISWGDNSTSIIANNDFIRNHTYSNPGNYTIVVKAKQNSDAIITKNTTIDIDYKETNLDNIKSNLFKNNNKEYLILTINLHTYQESQQDKKFNLIVDIIGKMDVDFIVFQECAQNKSSTINNGIIREDNMALIITDRIKEKYDTNYNYVWDWAHYGWNIWEEGVAVLSKHNRISTDSRYISTNTNTTNITSRKTIYGSYHLQDGNLNIFSVHTHWRTSLTDDEQNNQILNIQQMVDEKEITNNSIATFVCGDFNVNPTSDYPWSEGYNLIMQNNIYTDTYLNIYPDANNKPAQSIHNTIGGEYPGRIDYIFMKNNSSYEVVESQIVFTEDVVGRVSDHYGVLTKIKFIN